VFERVNASTGVGKQKTTMERGKFKKRRGLFTVEGRK